MAGVQWRHVYTVQFNIRDGQSLTHSKGGTSKQGEGGRASLIIRSFKEKVKGRRDTEDASYAFNRNKKMELTKVPRREET